MTEKERYIPLMVKYLDKSILDEELADLTHWLESDNQNLEFFLEMKDTWDLASLSTTSNDVADGALSAFHRMADDKRPVVRPVARFLKIAIQVAATLLLAVLLSFLYQQIKGTSSGESLFPEAYAQIKTQAGQRAMVTLPDGSTVWLNSGTYLKYPTAFYEDDVRKVYLDGEAYIEVAKDPQHPFLVETESLTVEATGTRFNIKSYDGENAVEATLIEGTVKIVPNAGTEMNFKEVSLMPNEKATYRKDEHAFTVDRVDVQTEGTADSQGTRTGNVPSGITQIESIISWKDNELIFMNETLEEICTKMERWYGISIKIEDDRLKTYRYNGKFVYNETVNQVMDILALTTPLTYTIDRNMLIIKGKE